MQKAGYKTTEFWATIAMLVISGLVAIGVVGQGEQVEATNAMTQAIVAAVALISAATVLWQYIGQRSQIKTLASLEPTVIELLEEVSAAGTASGEKPRLDEQPAQLE